MNHNNERVKQLLLSAYHSRLSETEATELVKISRIIISSYLRKFKNYFLETFIRHGHDISSITIDIISEAFQRNFENKFIILITFINSLRTPLSDIDTDELHLVYYTFLSKVADAHISRTYAQLDPNGYKIQRNIKETIESMPQFGVRKSGLGYFLYLKNFQNNGLAYLDYDILEKDFLLESVNKNTTRELLEVLTQILTEQEEYRKEIVLTDAVKLFKARFGFVEESYFDFDNYSLKEANQFEVKQLCSMALLKIKEKIFVEYFAKGKLTQNQAISLFKTMEDIVYDWIEFDGQALSFYEYYARNQNISKKEYDIYIKSKIEYLVKDVRKETALYFYTKE